MLHSTTKVAFLETWRSTVFRVALGVGAFLALGPILVPVRFRGPVAFALEGAPATSLLWGVFFAILCGLPSTQSGKFLFRAEVLGTPAWATLGVVLRHGLGLLLVFCLGSLLVLGVQLVGLITLPWWRPDVHWSRGDLATLVAGFSSGLLQGVGLLALARIIGVRLRFAPAALVFLALLFATQLLSSTLHHPLEGQNQLAFWQHSLGLLFPALDLGRHLQIASHDAAAWAWFFASTSLYWLTSNLVLTWILERLGTTLVPLDGSSSQS